MGWLGVLWHLVDTADGASSAGVLAGAAVLACVLLATGALLSRVVAGPRRPPLTRRVLRARASRTGVPRHRDPDAPGRSRPRAPTAALAAA